MSLTRRGEARRVQYITGHGRDGRLPADIDWASVADPAVTTVVYMPVKTLPELVAQRRREAGLDPATPAVAVERATRADERDRRRDDRRVAGAARRRAAIGSGRRHDRTRAGGIR